MNESTSKKPLFSLPVAGIIPFSATDWPGQLTITVMDSRASVLRVIGSTSGLAGR